MNSDDETKALLKRIGDKLGNIDMSLGILTFVMVGIFLLRGCK